MEDNTTTDTHDTAPARHASNRATKQSAMNPFTMLAVASTLIAAAMGISAYVGGWTVLRYLDRKPKPVKPLEPKLDDAGNVMTTEQGVVIEQEPTEADELRPIPDPRFMLFDPDNKIVDPIPADRQPSGNLTLFDQSADPDPAHKRIDELLEEIKRNNEALVPKTFNDDDDDDEDYQPVQIPGAGLSVYNLAVKGQSKEFRVYGSTIQYDDEGIVSVLDGSKVVAFATKDGVTIVDKTYLAPKE